MKNLFVLMCLLAFAAPAFAQEKKFFLEDDGSTTFRFEKIEGKVADLEKRVTALEKSALPPLKASKSPLSSTTTPAAVQYKTIQTKVCTNGVCRIVNQLVPITDGEVASTSGNPCPQGQCIDCQCAGAATASSFTSGTDDGWYLGKRLGRKK